MGVIFAILYRVPLSSVMSPCRKLQRRPVPDLAYTTRSAALKVLAPCSLSTAAPKPDLAPT